MCHSGQTLAIIQKRTFLLINLKEKLLCKFIQKMKFVNPEITIQYCYTKKKDIQKKRNTCHNIILELVKHTDAAQATNGYQSYAATNGQQQQQEETFVSKFITIN